MARARSRTGKLNVATWNVCPLSLTGRSGADYAEFILQKCKVFGCDAIELQETRRSWRTEFAAAGYRVFCSGEDGSSDRAGQHGVGLAVKESIVREATWTQELTNERLMSITFNLAGKSNAIIFMLWHMARQLLCPIRGNRRMRFGWIWIVLLVECPAAIICLFNRC